MGRGAWWAAAAIAAVCLGGCSRPVALAPGEVIEGELAPEDDVTYGLRLANDDYARVRVAPTVTDRIGEVSAVVSAPDDRQIAEAIGIRNEAGGVIAWVAGEEGIYRLRVANPDAVRSLPYRVIAEERREARPEDRHRTAAELAAAEAARLMSGDDPDKVAEALTRALGHWLQVGETDSVIATVLDLADVRASNDPDGAFALYNEALALGGDSPEWTIETLQRKGLLLGRRKECAGARAAFDEAKAVALGQGDLAATASATFRIGWLLKQCGSADLAIAAFEEALEYGRRAGSSSLQALCHREFARTAKSRGDLVAAKEEIETAARLAEASGDRQVLADVLHELANIERYRGQLAEALEHYQRCLEINESLARTDLVIPTLMTLGILSLDLRRSEQARDYFERALGLAEDSEDVAGVAVAERELGAVYERMHRFARAEEFFRRSLATADAIPREDLIAAAHFRLGHLLVRRERFSEAIPPLTAALERQRSRRDQRGLPLTLRVLGRAYWRLDEPETALEHLSKALEIEREQGDPLRMAWTLHGLAEVQAEQDPTAARQTIEEAIELSQEVRSGLAVDSLRVDFFQAPRSLYNLYVDLLVGAGDLPAAFAASEKGRAQGLLDLLIEAQVDPRADIDPELDREAREIDRRVSLAQGELRDALATGSLERAARIRDRLEEYRQRSQRLEAKIRQQSRRYRELTAPVVRTLGEVQASLPPTRVLLEYWLGTDRSHLFVVTHDSAAALPLPPERDLSERVERLRAALVGALPASRFGAEAHSLFLELVAPALEIAEGATELIIVPDGALNLLPFEALVTAPPAAGSSHDDLDYLIREVETTYAPSATVLASLGAGPGRERPRDARSLEFVAFADPDYGGPLTLACPTPEENRGSSRDASFGGDQLLPRLRGGRQEVMRIARGYGGSARIYVGPDATEQRVVSDPEVANAKRLHFAVHGVVCESRPESSGLILRLDDDAAEDGILETREIFDLHLAADLVVLSACDTGVGRIVRGEGVVGLTRAFFYAGVPSLVVSLWPVPDQSTSDLMAAFYRRMDEGESRAAALRWAKLRLIDAGGGKSAPLYWAPFILVGSRGAADTRRL